MPLSAGELKALVEGGHEDVFAVLGPHVVDGRALVIRAFLPQAKRVRVVPSAAVAPQSMERLHPAGVFEAVFSGMRQTFPYRLEVTDGEGMVVELDDPYRF